MDLFEGQSNPPPADPIISVARTRDGVRLRVARWSRPDARGTVLVAMGRGEFIEQYYEVVAALLQRLFDVVVFDWRGQGQSDRETPARGRGHVSSFAAYGRDLAAVEAQVLKNNAPRPWFGFGHSMGAAVLLEEAHRGTSPFERLFLSSPMIDVALRYRPVKRAVIRAMDAMGRGTWLIPGGSARSAVERGFEANLLTHDRRQFDRLASILRGSPKLVVGSPTVRWLSSAFDMMARFADPRFPVHTTTPILIIAAGDDRIVDTAATERFAMRLKAGRCVTIPGARHQIFMEQPGIVAQFWAAFDAFIPGERAPAQAAAEPKGRPVVQAPRRSWTDRALAYLRSTARPVARGRGMPPGSVAAPPPQRPASGRRSGSPG